MNNKKLSTAILINRLYAKDKITDKEITQYSLDFIRVTLNPKTGHWMRFYFKQKLGLESVYELISKALPYYILDLHKKKTDPKHKKQLKKFWKNYDYTKANEKIIAARGLKRAIKNERNRSLKIIHEYLDGIKKFKNDMIKNNWRDKHIKNHISIHYPDVSKWVDKSDKHIERNYLVVSHQIVLNQRTEIKNRRCIYCINPLDRKYVKGGRLGLRKEYTPRLSTPLTQDERATLAEITGKKRWRPQLKFSEEKYRQEQYVQEQGTGISNKEYYHIKKGKTWEDFDAFVDSFGVDTGLENDGRTKI